MKTTDSQYTAEVLFEAEHWNQNCGCEIPPAWVAYVCDPDGNPLPAWPCGDSREEAIRNVHREFPSCIIVG